MRTQMLAKPYSKLVQRAGGGDHQGSHAQLGWRTFDGDLSLLDLGINEARDWHKVGLSGDWCLSTALWTRSGTCIGFAFYPVGRSSITFSCCQSMHECMHMASWQRHSPTGLPPTTSFIARSLLSYSIWIITKRKLLASYLYQMWNEVFSISELTHFVWNRT